MEDDENGAKRLWNGDAQERSSIFLEQITEKYKKNAEKRDSQSSKSSSDDPFQAIFHFFIDFSRRKIDHFSRV